MKYPRLKLVFNRKKTATNVKAASVQLEVYYKAKRKYFATGVNLCKNQWSIRNGVERRNDSAQLNAQLDAFVSRFRTITTEIVDEDGEFTFESLERRINTPKNNLGASFIDFVAAEIESRADINAITKKGHRTLLGILTEFGKISTMRDLTRETIRKYDSWLHEKGYNKTTIHNYHKILKVYINRAIVKGIITENPYMGMKIERGKSKIRKFMMREELAMLENMEIVDASIAKVRDLFVFQCYTGLAYVDLERFDFTKVENRDGRLVLRDIRHKTGEDFYIVLLSPAVEILKRYDFKLPIITNQQYNLRLKVLGQMAGISRPITSHMGRHTFAVMSLNNGVRIENLAKMLGHTDIKTTQIYAKVLNAELECDFDNLEKKIGKRR